MIMMERIIYADYLRVIGIICVIGIHLSLSYVNFHHAFTNMWFQGILSSAITRAGVLLFIMVSGMLLLDREEPLSKVPQRLKRVLIPFYFWLFYYFMKDVLLDHQLVNVNSTNTFFIELINVLSDPTKISIEFWYIYMIVAFYLMLPLLYQMIKHVSEKEIEYFLVIWFIVLLLNFFKHKIYILNYMNLFTGPLGYFILGYYLHKKDSKYTKSKKFGLTLFLLGILILILSFYIPALIAGQTDTSYILVGNIEPGSCLKMMGLFIIFKNINFKKVFGKYSDKINSYILKFAGYTYGIYLIVNIPLDFIKDHGWFNLEISPFINIPLLITISIIISIIILYVMNKIPILKKVTGMKN
ncbi:acyltransferase [Methanosphaera sp. ISO3-F5]|uniref:acyltransferase n=1 Tax=Methanosphaera sp. ISO3-F5 TaxID=1452353 RepID=UPI002B260EFF|nr:acyltransferase [Methanosphaera sp. ISO3-F5]WQH65061.1 acyltransferase [Methanosphaera sp. ISO3-F5]